MIKDKLPVNVSKSVESIQQLCGLGNLYVIPSKDHGIRDTKPLDHVIAVPRVATPCITNNSTPVFIHWLAVVFSSENQAKFIEELTAITGLDVKLSNASSKVLADYHCGKGLVLTNNSSLMLDIASNKKMLILTGTDCELVTNWYDFYQLLKTQSEVRVNRIDLTVDVNLGLKLPDIISAYRRGRFTFEGKPTPVMTPIGDFTKDNGSARTVMIGKRQNGKSLRCYEVGRKMQTPTREEVRLELELRAVKRIIPLDVILNPAAYFSGAYPYVKQRPKLSTNQRPIVSTFSLC